MHISSLLRFQESPLFLTLRALLILFLCACLFSSDPAEARSCPENHEAVVTSQGIDCKPLAVYSERPSGGGKPARPAKLKPWVFVVWHPDFNDVFAATGYPDGMSALTAALQACSAVAGEGCTPATGAEGGAVAVAREGTGYFAAADGETAAKARSAVLNDCKSRNVSCEIYRIFKANEKFGLPGVPANIFVPSDIDEARKRYGVIAGVPEMASQQPGQLKLWIATGDPWLERAKQLAIGTCEAATGLSCEILFQGTDGLISIFKGSDDVVRAQWGMTDAAVRQGMEEACANLEISNCLILKTFDVTQHGDEELGPF
jgi:Domain of unknown function (DUF4189)